MIFFPFSVLFRESVVVAVNTGTAVLMGSFEKKGSTCEDLLTCRLLDLRGRGKVVFTQGLFWAS